MIKTDQFYYKLVIAMLLSCGFIINGMGILSPAYFSIMVSLVILLFFLIELKSKNLYLNLWIFFVDGYFFLELFINKTSSIQDGLFVIFSLLTYVIFDLIFGKLSKEDIIKTSVIYVKTLTFFFMFEFIFRLYKNHFTITNLFDPSFYLYKFYIFKEGTLFGGSDTNFICTHLLSLFFFGFYLTKRYKINLNKYLFILIMCVFFTFCRSGWISLVLGLITIQFIYGKNCCLHKGRIVFSLIFVIAVLFLLLKIFLKDASFLTKIDIFQKTVFFLNNYPLQNRLFGLGYLNSIQVVGEHVAHTLISTFLMDTGFVGLFLYLTVWGLILKESKYYALFIFIPIFIFSLSFIQQMIPFLFALLAIITKLEEKNGFNNRSCIQC